MKNRNREKWVRSQVVSNRCYYAYHFYVREGSQLPFFYGEKLFQQFAVDTWVSYEQRRLNWARIYQNTLRSELYQRLQNTTIHNRYDRENAQHLGYKIILSFSYVGSPRFMTQLFQDTMAIFRYFHKLDLFLTITANPK